MKKKKKKKCVFFDKSTTGSQIAAMITNIILRIILSLYLLNRFPRPSLILLTLPFLSILGSLCFSIQLHELLEMGGSTCKYYDGYRYHRAWYLAFFLNIPFNISAIILVATGYIYLYQSKHAFFLYFLFFLCVCFFFYKINLYMHPV